MEILDRHRSDLVIFLAFLIITTIGLYCRNLLNNNEKIRFIGDTIGNIGGVIVASFLFFWLAKESVFKKRVIIIFSVGLGFIIYEFLQVIIPWQTFDINDIYGTLIGVLIASIINILTIVSRNNNRTIKNWNNSKDLQI